MALNRRYATREEEDGVSSPYTGPKELRVALAMRGGVSLAVWIGGALAELDLARRRMVGGAIADDDEGARADAYCAVLNKLGYSSVTFDVLAGASAGGLNAVIYGFAQSVGADLEWLKGVWQERGDIWKLFHPQWDGHSPFSTEAVFDADTNFYGPVFEALKSHVPAETEGNDLQTAYLTVDLSATLQSGPPLPDHSSKADIRPRTAHFRFRHTPTTLGAFNDIPSRAAANVAGADDRSLQQLAYAARATSSFPGAFEPASVFSYGDEAPAPGKPVSSVLLNMRHVFSEVACSSEASFDVMDGGVFDNIPIGRAIQAIADAPASQPTKRILIYLDPSPAAVEAARPVQPAYNKNGRVQRAQFIRSVFTALKYKQTVESSWDDLRDLQQLKEETQDRAARRTQFIKYSGQTQLAGPPESDVLTLYAADRARSDATRVVGLMTEPGVGFLRTLVPPPAVASALGLDHAQQMQKRIQTELTALLHRDGEVAADATSLVTAELSFDELAGDATSLVSAAELFISWIRTHQEDPGASLGVASALAAAKERLYRVRTAGLYAQQSREASAVLGALGNCTPVLIDASVIAAKLWPAGPLYPPQSFPVLDSDEALWDALADPEAGQNLDALVTSGWRELRDAINEIAEPQANPVLIELCRPGQAVLLDVAWAQWLTVRATVTVGALGTTAVPDFFTITADQQPPAQFLDGLSLVRAEGEALELNRRATDRSVTTSSRLPVNADSKLAGNQLANFAGFLTKEWRTHDWQWGRADAGAGLLRVLEELAPENKCVAHAEFESARQSLGPLYEDLNRVRPRPGSLAKRRLFAITARLGLGLQRALWPLVPKAYRAEKNPIGKLTPMSGLWAAAMLLLRPVLVLIPLLTRPAVLLGLMLAVSGAHHLKLEATNQPHGLGPGVLLLSLMAIAGLLGSRIVALLNQEKAWSSLGQSPVPSEDLIRRPGSRILMELAWAAAMLAVVVAFLVLITCAHVTLPLSGFDMVVLIGILTARNLLLRRVQARVLNPMTLVSRPFTLTSQAAIVAAVGVVLLIAVAFAWRGMSLDMRAGVATSVVVAAIIWATHHGWTKRWWPAAMALIGGAVTALVVSPWVSGVRIWVEEISGGTVAPVFKVAMPLLLVVPFLTVQFGRWFGRPRDSGEPTRGRSKLALVASLVVVPLIATFGAWMLTLSWQWLKAVPLALILGAVVAATTSVVAPFGDLDDDDTPQKKAQPSTQTGS